MKSLMKGGATSTPATPTTTKELKIGSVVTIAKGAVYGGLSTARGKAVPSTQTGGKKHTVKALATNKGVKEALLKEINSWVAVKSLAL